MSLAIACINCVNEQYILYRPTSTSISEESASNVDHH